MKHLLPALQSAHRKAAKHLLKKGFTRKEVSLTLAEHRDQALTRFDKFMTVMLRLPPIKRREFAGDQIKLLEKERVSISGKTEKGMDAIIRIGEIDARIAQIRHMSK
ncbi:MAG TPA: hypothetical protein VJH23_05380 [archaeon]|nr:hypothetical protein [archaeon]